MNPKESRLRQLVRADPAIGINKVNEILRQEFGSGIRKTVALDLKADELGKIRKPKVERQQRFTPRKYLQLKVILIKFTSTLKIEDELVEEFENLYHENSKKTKKQLIVEIKNFPYKKKRSEYMKPSFEIFESVEDAEESLALDKADEDFILGKIFPVSQEKNLLQLLAATLEISEGELGNWENLLRSTSFSIKNQKFFNFVKELT